MKRSEMVQIIWKRLEPLGVSEETCSEVIGILEKAGMIPPRCELPKLGISDNAWEPENE
jgi:hypothetical protein